MLIDRSYFVGEINIPNSDQPAVGELLDLFIGKYEREFFERALGRDVYEAFKVGLATTPVADKWQQLLGGASYSRGDQERYYPGFVSNSDTVIAAMNSVGTVDLVVDRGGDNDPVSVVGGMPNNAMTIPAAFVNKPFTIEQRAVGDLRPDEYTVSGNHLTLNSGYFNPYDTYFLKSAVISGSVVDFSTKKSPIANYIYYWFMRNNLTQTTTMGEVVSKNENSAWVNGNHKLVLAWNEMSEFMAILFDFLDVNRDVYEWSRYRFDNCYSFHSRMKDSYFRKINQFNI